MDSASVLGTISVYNTGNLSKLTTQWHRLHCAMQA
jgi:hypothetical protein